MSHLSCDNHHIVSLSSSERSFVELSQSKLNILKRDGNEYRFFPENRILTLEDSAKSVLDSLCDFDVLDFSSDNHFRILYKADSNDNAIFVTNKCNSNCIMCPCSEYERKSENYNSIEYLCELVKYIPSDTKFLTITGGEPTLIGEDIYLLLDEMRNHFEGTQLYILTNGRTFSDSCFTQKFIEKMPAKVRFAIPFYGFDSSSHDRITQAKGSFVQSINGVKNLLAYNCDIEIRIVVSKLNYQNMTKISEFIVHTLDGIDCVHIMATELMGAAAKNKDIVYLDYYDAFQASKEAIQTFIAHEIDVQLYNFPLCKVDPGYRTLCAKSISDYKIRFAESCKTCELQPLCGGVFNSTLKISKMELNPIIGETI